MLEPTMRVWVRQSSCKWLEKTTSSVCHDTDPYIAHISPFPFKLLRRQNPDGYLLPCTSTPSSSIMTKITMEQYLWLICDSCLSSSLLRISKPCWYTLSSPFCLKLTWLYSRNGNRKSICRLKSHWKPHGAYEIIAQKVEGPLSAMSVLIMFACLRTIPQLISYRLLSPPHSSLIE